MKIKSATKRQVEQIQALTIESVIKAYSGIFGCRCGCLGDYRCTAEMRERAGATTEVSRAFVRRILSVIQANAAKATVLKDYIVDVQIKERSFTIYLLAKLEKSS